MKLIGLPHSPYSARVRMQIYAKGIDVEIAAPEEFGTEAFKRFNPLGKVPVLDTGERMLPESTVIMDYLEDTHPHPPMRPADPGQRALMSLFCRFPDVYIQPALFPLFQQLTANPRDGRSVRENRVNLCAQLTNLERLMSRYDRGIRDRLDLADCALVPILFYATQVPAILDGTDVLTDVPLVRAWWQWVRDEEPAARVLRELDTSLRTFLQRSGGSNP